MITIGGVPEVAGARRRGERVRLVVAAACVLAGVILLTQPWWSGWMEARAQQRLAREFANGLMVPPAQGAPTPPATGPDLAVRPHAPSGPAPVAHLQIPAIGVDAYVLGGLTFDPRVYEPILRQGPGLLAGTALPGQPGNSVVFGHRDIYGSVFGELWRLKPGNRVLVDADGHHYLYRVKRVWAVSPDDLSVLQSSPGKSELTLITCTGPDNTLRLVVRAEKEAGVATP